MQAAMDSKTLTIDIFTRAVAKDSNLGRLKREMEKMWTKLEGDYQSQLDLIREGYNEFMESQKVSVAENEQTADLREEYFYKPQN